MVKPLSPVYGRGEGGLWPRKEASGLFGGKEKRKKPQSGGHWNSITQTGLWEHWRPVASLRLWLCFTLVTVLRDRVRAPGYPAAGGEHQLSYRAWAVDRHHARYWEGTGNTWIIQVWHLLSRSSQSREEKSTQIIALYLGIEWSSGDKKLRLKFFPADHFGRVAAYIPTSSVYPELHLRKMSDTWCRNKGKGIL